MLCYVRPSQGLESTDFAGTGWPKSPDTTLRQTGHCATGKRRDAKRKQKSGRRKSRERVQVTAG